ncbi:MAG: pyridoxal-phosphate dependent enzyme [Myxococcota bacterium]
MSGSPPESGRERALLGVHPRLEASVPWVRLGVFPTPVAPLDALAEASGWPRGGLWEKRDDRSSPLYGGNKVRTLEVLFGDALADEATHVYATGGFGSNHGTATVLHAPRCGLTPGAMLFPQPASQTAADNLEVMLTHGHTVKILPHLVAFPTGWWQLPREARARGERAYVMEPGGAVPLGALGYVSAGWELAHQVAAGALPRPRVVVVPVGSNCTVAGLVLGFRYAAEAGVGFVDGGAPAPPLAWAVRVTPWPVTTARRILRLAHLTSRLLAARLGDATLVRNQPTLAPGLRVDPRHLGRGYGRPTAAGRAAMRRWRATTTHALETTYSGKAAAAFLDIARTVPRGPVLFWSTKSSAPLPPADPAAIRDAPPSVRRWLSRCSRSESGTSGRG